MMPSQFDTTSESTPGNENGIGGSHFGLTKVAFFLSTFLFVVANFALSGWPAIIRNTPVETDDGYTYIIKASQFEHDFFQHSPALLSIHDELLERSLNSEDESAQWLAYREYHRAFLVYHPLHSAILATLHSLGLSWEETYRYLWCGGLIFLSLMAAYFLQTAVGTLPATISLLILCFKVFPHQGIHQPIPSSLCLGIALLSWAEILRGRRSPLLSGLVATALMLSMHPIGKLYSGISLVLLIVKNWGNLSKQRATLVSIFGGALIIVVATVAPHLFSSPHMVVTPDPAPSGWSTAHGIWMNLYETKEMVKSWFGSWLYFILVTAIAVPGLFALKKVNYGHSIKLVAIFSILAFISPAHILPRYPGELFSRVSVPMLLLYVGFFSSGLIFFISSAKKRTTELRTVLGLWRISRALALSGAGIGLALTFLIMDRNVHDWLSSQKSLTDRFAFIFDLNQVRNLTEIAKPEDRVLYLAEEPMHFFWVHGADQLKSIFLPPFLTDSNWREAKKIPGIDTRIMDSIPNGYTTGGHALPEFIVGFNPLIQSVTPQSRTKYTGIYNLNDGTLYGTGNGISIGGQAGIELSSDTPLTVKRIDINCNVAPSSLNARIIRRKGELTIQDINLPSSKLNELPASLANVSLNNPLNIFLDSTEDDCKILGITLAEGSDKLNWPWGSPLNLRLINKEFSQISNSYRFKDISALGGPLGKVTVIDDRGSLIVLKVENSGN